jgi:hypothetical protein
MNILFVPFSKASIDPLPHPFHNFHFSRTILQHWSSSYSPSSSSSRIKGKYILNPKDRISIIRGGGTHQPTDPTRSFWSSSSVHQPTSFSSSPRHPSSSSSPWAQSQTQNQYSRRLTVTDVTNDVRDQERVKTKDAINAFLTRESRNSFIVKVYAILTGQLLLVALSALMFGRYSSMGRWMITRGRIGKSI